MLRFYLKQFFNNQKGELSDAIFKIGAAVIVVLVIVAIIAIAPGQATALFNRAIEYARQSFGL